MFRARADTWAMVSVQFQFSTSEKLTFNVTNFHWACALFPAFIT